MPRRLPDARVRCVVTDPQSAPGTRRYLFTGAPGCGKTAILARLSTLGYPVVAEAATDVIASDQAAGTPEPWRDPGFPDRIVALQRARERAASGPVQLYDRSPICSLALAWHLGHPVTDLPAAEVDRVVRDGVHDRRVFFVRPLGFVTPTPARRISFAESLEFEKVHEMAYQASGYELVDVPPADVAERAALVGRCIRSWSSG